MKYDLKIYILIKGSVYMRFSGNLYLYSKENYNKIPTNYRISISSLIKEAINRHDTTGSLYDKYFSNKKSNKIKPYTYSIYIPVKETENTNKRNFLISDNKLTFFFSSNDYELSTAVYNGLIKINQENSIELKNNNTQSDKVFQIFNYPVKIKNFYLKLDPEITGTKAKFKTLSPLVLRKLKDHKSIGYSTFMDKDFKQMLFYSIQNLAQNFISKDYVLNDKDFNVNLIDPKVVKIYHYNSVMPSTKGIMELSAPNEILQLVYDIGIGARRSQGFGMLEVV